MAALHNLAAAPAACGCSWRSWARNCSATSRADWCCGSSQAGLGSQRGATPGPSTNSTARTGSYAFSGSRLAGRAAAAAVGCCRMPRVPEGLFPRKRHPERAWAALCSRDKAVVFLFRPSQRNRGRRPSLGGRYTASLHNLNAFLLRTHRWWAERWAHHKSFQKLRT